MLCSYSNDNNNMSTPDVQLIREVSSAPVDYLYVYIYSWEIMGSMDKCPDYGGVHNTQERLVYDWPAPQGSSTANVTITSP